MPSGWQMLLWMLGVAAFGAGVGLAELVSRYRDAPVRAVQSGPAYLYIGINALASVLALVLIRVFDWQFGLEGSPDTARVLWLQSLVAGFGAMALFRASLFTVRVGDKDLAIGPQSLLQVILDSADRGVDRVRAASRAAEVAHVMAELSFSRAHIGLPTLCLELMQNLPVDQQIALGEELRKLRDSSIDEPTKALVLGLTLMNVVGYEVLLAAVSSAGPRLRIVQKLVLADTSLSMRVGERRQLQASAEDVTGVVVPGEVVVWSDDGGGVIEVDSSGKATALSAGLAYATASVDRHLAQVEVEVLDRRATPE